MIVVIYKGKGREGTKQVPFTSKALAIKKAKDLYKYISRKGMKHKCM